MAGGEEAGEPFKLPGRLAGAGPRIGLGVAAAGAPKKTGNRIIGGTERLTTASSVESPVSRGTGRLSPLDLPFIDRP